MNTYIAVVLPTEDKAHSALRTLWRMDDYAKITVHGAAIVHRDEQGHIRVAERHSDIGLRTAMGVGIGALLGLLAGPVGVAFGIAGAAALPAVATAGLAAFAGGVAGVTADALTEDRREEAADEGFFKLGHGQSAVVADVSELPGSTLDHVMKSLGGVVYRRKTTEAMNAAFGRQYYSDHLLPYYYEPIYYDPMYA